MIPIDAERRRRPRRVTILAGGVFTLGLVNGWRAGSLAAQYPWLSSLPITLDPRLRFMMAALWALVFLAVAVALWRGRTRGRTAVPLALTVYALYRWLLLAFYVVSPVARARWPALLAAHGAGLVFSLWVVHSAAGRAFFRASSPKLAHLSPGQTVPQENVHV